MKSDNMVYSLITVWSHITRDITQAKTEEGVVFTGYFITLFIYLVLIRNHRPNHFCCSDHRCAQVIFIEVVLCTFFNVICVTCLFFKYIRSNTLHFNLLVLQLF